MLALPRRLSCIQECLRPVQKDLRQKDLRHAGIWECIQTKHFVECHFLSRQVTVPMTNINSLVSELSLRNEQQFSCRSSESRSRGGETGMVVSLPSEWKPGLGMKPAPHALLPLAAKTKHHESRLTKQLQGSSSFLRILSPDYSRVWP